MWDTTKVPLIGILGGGQLAMMMIESAHRMSIKVAVLDPNPSCPASRTADIFVKGNFKNDLEIESFVDETYLINILF